MNSRIVRFALVVTLLCFALPSSAEVVPVPAPTVIGPIEVNAEPGDPSHDYPFFTPLAENLIENGVKYVEEEFFIEGLAHRYNTPMNKDGRIRDDDQDAHPYRTRIVVRRPKSPDDFSGVVILEWQNVTAGYEIDALWAPSWQHFIRKGYAWVGVSVQQVGVHGFPESLADVPVLGDMFQGNNGLTAWSPVRYGTLDLTDGGTVMDDSLCYDVFSQAAQAIRASSAGLNPIMGGMHVDTLIAAGASQSAYLLSVYHNAIHPLHKVVDGISLIVGGAAMRTDLDVKVFQYLSESDLSLGTFMRLRDSDHFRSWEVAGAAHSAYASEVYHAPLTTRDFDGEEPWDMECDNPPFSRVHGHFVINAQYDQLVRWIQNDTTPPRAPKIKFTKTRPRTIERDEFGIALGGIRLPGVEVPIALNNGVNSGGIFCMLFGTHEPFDADTLAELYPSHDDYVRAVKCSAIKNALRGFIPLADAKTLIQDAIASDIGN